MIDINKNKKDDLSEVKKRIFDIIQIGTRIDIFSTVFDVIISILIIVSIVVTFLNTFESLHKYRPLFMRIEVITTVIFIAEYLLRIFTSDLLYPNEKLPKSIFKFVFSFYGIVDLLTIISYFSSVYSNGFIVLRLIRVIRILRLFRINNRTDAFNVMANVIYEKRNQIMSSLFVVLLLMISASFCMYSLEHDAQPEVFDNAFAGIWWAMSTVLTVGYGDIYPVTLGGKIVAIFIALLGVGAVAIPTGIISAGFVEYYTKLNMTGGSLMFKSDIQQKLDRQAAHAGISPSDYIERIILEKEWEYKNNIK